MRPEASLWQFEDPQHSALPAGNTRNTADELPAHDFAPGLDAAFPERFQECDCRLEIPDVQIPDYVQGTYYFNGPARFASNGFAYKHWLDGDGMVCAARFDKHDIRLRSRYIRSNKFLAEQSAGKPCFRAFGSTFAGSRLNRVNNGLESPVNISVYPFEGRLLAFGEQGLPWELDPETLETRGQFTFHGRLNDASPLSAHPKFDPDTGEMFNFGIFFSTQTPRLYLYCFGPDGLRYRKPVPLQYPCTVHDFSLSKNCAVFYLSPYLLDHRGLAQNDRTIMDCLRWEPERGSRLLVLARSTAEVVASIPVGDRYCLHLVNAFEENGRLTVDVLELDEPVYSQYQPVPNLFHNVARGGPVRFVIDLQSRELVERVELDYSRAPDFPAVDPRLAMRSYDDFWMLGISATGYSGRKFFDQLVHASWKQREVGDIYQSPPMRYLGGEPVFVGRPCSPEAVVICQEFDASARQSNFVLFDAWNVGKGPVCRIASDKILHFGFHAAFRPVGSHVQSTNS